MMRRSQASAREAPAPAAPPLMAPDDGLFHLHHAQDERLVELDDRLLHLGACELAGEDAQILAGGESGSFRGQQDGAHLRVVRRSVHGVQQFTQHGGSERIPPLDPIEADGGDSLTNSVENGLIGGHRMTCLW